jgi:hypothetical protein
MNEWQPIESAPPDKLVMTKIDDADGVRNEQAMMKRGNLWWIKPGEPNEMYVYFRPTHWKPMEPCA